MVNEKDLKVSAMSNVVTISTWGSNNTTIGCITRGHCLC